MGVGVTGQLQGLGGITVSGEGDIQKSLQRDNGTKLIHVLLHNSDILKYTNEHNQFWFVCLFVFCCCCYLVCFGLVWFGVLLLLFFVFVFCFCFVFCCFCVCVFCLGLGFFCFFFVLILLVFV